MNGLLDTMGYWTIRCVSALLARLPVKVGLAMGSFLGFVAFYFSGRRHNAYADLKMVFQDRFDEKTLWEWVKKHYRYLGKTAMDIIRFPSLDQSYVRRMVDVNHIERFHEAIAEGRGVILLTAHFGNWELLQIISGILGHPLHVLAQDQKSIKLNEMLNRLRESHGSKAVSKGMGIRELYRAL